jgi:hypothetical protein
VHYINGEGPLQHHFKGGVLVNSHILATSEQHLSQPHGGAREAANACALST